ncbi:nucleotidyltransferase domain-containing protein [Candidatus Bathyarchaeota archaeon]|nr:nucleotidyltransferase domain-containing protein [Candidatus Bathyarchaeota archaeon]
MKGNRTKMLRNRVAQEAALLLYTSQEKEYKQAKQRAADTLGVRGLPSNFEVAEELDIIAEEREGAQRRELLLRMRMEAKEIMETLKIFNPRLVGSVWRGTARQNSDIDIHTFSQDHHQVLDLLQKRNYEVERSEWCSVTKAGTKEASFHIHAILPSGDAVEVVVRSLECLGQPERCVTYGDSKTGMNFKQLVRTIKENPLQKFVPK